jgi:hypothetical protein
MQMIASLLLNLSLAYFSMEAAAHDALIDAYNCSEGRRECGGVIYERPADKMIPYTLYFYSALETSDKPFGTDVKALALTPPRHMKLVADFHNHLCLGRHKELVGVFSEADQIMNKGFHTIGYILDGCTGNIHRYDPASDVNDFVIVYTSGRQLELSSGHITGWINVFRSIP